jgi:HK97 family phage major capsid protein
MKKLFLFALALVGVIAATAFDYSGVSLATLPVLLTAIKVEGATVKNFTEYLSALGVADISKTSDPEAEAVDAYYKAKLSYENRVLTQKVEKLQGETDPEAVKSLTDEVAKLKEGRLADLENALKSQGELMKALEDGRITGASIQGVENEIKTVLEAHKDDFKKAKEGRHDFKFTVNKAVGDMTFSGNVTGTMPQATRLPGVNDIAERMPKIYDLAPKLTVAGNTIEWVYETAQEGAIDGTAEGASKDQLDNNFVVDSVSLVKRAAYFKLSTEMLDDVTFMEAWIRNKLLVRLLKDVDNQVLQGDDSAPNTNSLINQATAWAAGNFANSIYNANEIDVLNVGIGQIANADQELMRPVIVVNPEFLTSLLTSKVSTTDKRYNDYLREVASNGTLRGIPIVTHTAIGADTFLIADMARAIVVEKGSVNIEVGLDGNDFTKNMRTILAEWRGNVIIENNDRTAFVTGDFSTSQAALLLT